MTWAYSLVCSIEEVKIENLHITIFLKQLPYEKKTAVHSYHLHILLPRTCRQPDAGRLHQQGAFVW